MTTTVRNSPSGPDVEIEGGGNTDDIVNVSELPGETLTEALDSLVVLSSDDISNASVVPGSTVTEALDDLDARGLPDGTYTGQPVVWDGDSYIPTDPDFPARRFRVREIRDLQGQEGIAFGISAENDVGISLVSTNAVGNNLFLVTVTNGTDLSAGLQLGKSDFTLSISSGAVMAASSVEGSPTALAFFGETPVERPTITGATTQDQVDSIVDALVALGLAIDGR